MSRKYYFAILAILVIWTISHIPGILYGSNSIPLHQSYIGDEQSPVNAAFHAIKEKSLWGFRNNPNLYYGPVMAVLAIPPVVIDAGFKYVSGKVHSSAEYANYILYDWGGIVVLIHITSVLASLLGLVAVWKISGTRTFNPNQSLDVRFFLLLLVSFNYYFFEYSHFFKHWTFVISALMWAFYVFIKITESQDQKQRYILWAIELLLAVFIFGVSYIGVAYMLYMIPFLWSEFKAKEWGRLKEFLFFAGTSLVGFIAIYFWHPYAFLRLLDNKAFVPNGGEDRTTSLIYYLDLIFENHYWLLVPLLILTGVAVYKRKLSKIFVGSIAVALLNFLIFVKEVRYEGRYMEVTIIFLIIAFINIFSTLRHSGLIQNKLRNTVYSFLIFGLVFHTVAIAKWIKVYSKDHPEREIIGMLIDWQRSNPDKKAVIVAPYLLGVTHSKDAYADYALKTKKSEVNLYKSYQESTLPVGILPINLYYYYPIDYSKVDKDPLTQIESRKMISGLQNIPWDRLAADYDFVAYEYTERIEPNQFDYFDQDITSIFYFERLYKNYFRIK